MLTCILIQHQQTAFACEIDRISANHHFGDDFLRDRKGYLGIPRTVNCSSNSGMGVGHYCHAWVRCIRYQKCINLTPKSLQVCGGWDYMKLSIRLCCVGYFILTMHVPSLIQFNVVSFCSCFRSRFLTIFTALVSFVINHCIVLPFFPVFRLVDRFAAGSLNVPLWWRAMLLDPLMGVIIPMIFLGPVGAIVYTVRSL